MIKTLLLLLTFCTSLVFAQQAEDLYWQKINLEKRIDKRVEDKIKNLINEKDYIISSQVEVLETIKQKKKISNNEIKVTPLSKFDLDFERDIVKDVSDGVKTISISEKIKSIQIDVHFSQFVPEEIKQRATEILKKTFPKLFSTKIKYQFNQFERVNYIPKKSTPLWEKFSTPITLIALALISFVAMFIGLSKFQNIGVSMVSALEGLKPSESATKGDASAQAGGSTVTGEMSGDLNTQMDGDVSMSGENMEIILGKYEGVKKFNEFIKSREDDAANIVRRWSKEQEAAAQSAVGIALKSLSFSELEEFLDNFDTEERYELKDKIKQQNKISTVDTDQFIQEEMANVILLPNYVEDKELSKSLGKAPFDKLLDIANTSGKLASVLMGILPPSTSKRLAQELDYQIFVDSMQYSMDFSKESIQDDLIALKDALSEINTTQMQDISPLFRESEELLATASAQKESVLFDILRGIKTEEEFTITAWKFFPQELMEQFPDIAIKTTLNNMELGKRIEYLVSLDDQQRSHYLSFLGSEGSKIREVLDFEIQETLSNEERMVRIQENIASVQQEFVNTARRIVHSPSVKFRVSTLLEDWVKSKYSKDAQHEKFKAAS